MIYVSGLAGEIFTIFNFSDEGFFSVVTVKESKRKKVSYFSLLVQHASEREDLNSQIEAACALVEKLITENADLVEKVKSFPPPMISTEVMCTTSVTRGEYIFHAIVLYVGPLLWLIISLIFMHYDVL